MNAITWMVTTLRPIKMYLRATPQTGRLSINEMATSACESPSRISESLDKILGAAEQSNAVSHIFTTILSEAARKRAQELEAIPEADRSHMPLYGVPFALKDNCDIAGAPTTCNSRSMPNTPAARSGSLVQALENAGAICIGKTALSEFALGDIPADSPWPDPINPLLPTHVAGSSSSGSAAAVAAGLVPFAIGTDTGGSIRNPAASMGLYGLKPTFGSIFLDGIYPLAPSLDTAGPITHTLEDLELVSRVLYPTTALSCGTENIQTVGFLRRFWENQTDTDHEICEAMDRLHEHLVSNHVGVIDVKLPPIDVYDETGWTILKYEAYQIHAERLEALSSQYGEPLYRDLMAGKAVSYTDYCIARQKAQELSTAVDRALESVDFLASPTACRLLPSLGDKDLADQFTSSALRIPFNVTGHPALATPTLWTPGDIPVAVQWTTRKFGESGYFSRVFKLIHQIPGPNKARRISGGN